MTKLLRIFISSPGDVGLERNLTLGVIERLRGEFSGRLDIEAIRWEDRPVRATQSFQPQIIPPSKTDIVVCILWSRLGTLLSEEYTRPDGSRYGSGTEWEFEDAVRSWRESRSPDILVYRRTQDPLTSIRDLTQFQLRQEQYHALEGFIQKWFFSDDGAFKAAFKSYESPDLFERQVETDLRHLILEHLPKHVGEKTEQADVIRWHQGSPFCGLSSFDLDRAPVFFGRTKAISDVKDALVRQAEDGKAFLVIFGMSGCGKSSLARAGLLAAITRPGVVEAIDVWRWCVFRPTDSRHDLCRVLADAIVSPSALPEFLESGASVEDLASILCERPKHAAPLIAMALHRVVEKQNAQHTYKSSVAAKDVRAKLVIVVDQLEEIFTRDQTNHEQRTAFVEALSALARSGHVWVLATMRSDFYPRCLEVPELVALKEGDGQYDLLPPTFDEIDQMIVYPARAAGLRFEVEPASGQRLNFVLHETAASDPQAMPLLSFTMDELYRRRTEDGFLTFTAYRELGGLEGALAQRAEEVFQSLPSDVQATLPGLMRGLVTIEPNAEDIIGARRVPRESLTTSPQIEKLLEALIQARLIVTDRATDGQIVVRVAHEALFTRWPRAWEVLMDDRDFLRIRSRLAHQTERWISENKRSDLLLPTGRLLAEAEETLRIRRDDLDVRSIGFVTASLRRRRNRRIALLASTTVLGGLFTIGGSIAYGKWRQWTNEISLSAEDREKNRREAMSLKFEQQLPRARGRMLGPQASGVDSALEFYSEYRSIAKELANTPNEEEKIKWTIKEAEILLKMAEAYAKQSNWFKVNQDVDNARAAQRKSFDHLELRKSLLTSLPPEAQKRSDASLSAFSEFSNEIRTLTSLQIELLTTNEQLKLAAWRDNRHRANEKPSLPVNGSSDASSSNSMSGEQTADQYFQLPFFEETLKISQLMAETTGQKEDWELYIGLNQVFGNTAQERYQRPDLASKFYTKAIESAGPVVQSILAPSGVPEAFASHGASPQDLAPLFFPGYAGISFIDQDSKILVDVIQAGSPSEAAGITKGSQLVGFAVQPQAAIQSVEGLKAKEAILQMRGPEGVPLRLVVVSPDDGQELTFTLNRVLEPVTSGNAKWLQHWISLHGNLAESLLSEKNAQKARLVCERGLAVLKWTPAEYNASEFVKAVYFTRCFLASALDQLGQKQQAIELLKLAVNEATAGNAAAAAKATQEVLKYRKNASAGLLSIGEVDLARTELESAVDLQRNTLLLKPDEGEERRLTELLLRLADFLDAHDKQPGSSLPALREAFAICEKSLKRSNQTAESEATARVSWIKTGMRLFNIYKKQNQTVEATSLALELEPIISAHVAASQKADQPPIAYEAAKQGATWFHALGNIEQELAAFSSAVELLERLVNISDDRRRELVYDYFNLARLAGLQGDWSRFDSELAKFAELSTNALGPDENYMMQSKAKALSVSLRLRAKRLGEVGPLVQKALNEPFPTSNESLLKTYGDDELGHLSVLSESANEAGATDIAIAAGERRRELAQRLIELEDNAKRRRQFLNALNFLGGLQAKNNNLESAASAYETMKTAAVQANTAFKQTSFEDDEADAASSLAHVRLKQNRLDESEALFSHAQGIWQRLCNSGELPKTRLASVAYAVQGLASVSNRRKDWGAASTWTQQRIELLEEVLKDTADTASQRRISNAYLSLGWYRLLEKKYQASIEASNQSIERLPGNQDAAVNLVTAYLLNDQYEEASKVFDQFHHQLASDGRAFTDVLRTDFAELRDSGMDHSNLKKFEDRMGTLEGEKE